MDVKIKDLKNTIKMIREFKGFTQKQLSQETNLSQSVVSYVETSEGGSTIDTIKRISDALGYELMLKFVPKKGVKNKNVDQSNSLKHD